jgi:hypothetical protein
MLFGSALFGGLGAVLAFTHGGEGERAVGGVLMGVGALIDVSWLPTTAG